RGGESARRRRGEAHRARESRGLASAGVDGGVPASSVRHAGRLDREPLDAELRRGRAEGAVHLPEARLPVMSTTEADVAQSAALTEHFDVLIVGAGISGIGAAYHLTHQCPGTRFVVLEAQSTFGGTWITHRFP